MKKYIPLCWIIVCCCLSVLTVTAYAEANITVSYGDAANTGFNDKTRVIAVGGNTATTLGEQRKAALNYTLTILAKTFSSPTPIKITANFSALGGTGTTTTLASAGANTLHFDFDNAPLSNTYYPAALANKLAQQDLDPDSADIYANFNSDVDGDVVLGSSHWYYGFDGKPPGNDIDFISVSLHELLHGMGFLSLVNVNNGKKFSGKNDIFSNFFDRFNTSPSAFNLMTDAQRASAAKATGLLHWIGAVTKANSGQLSAGVTSSRVHIYAPDPIEVGSSLSHLSDQVSPHQLMEPAYTGAHHDLGIAAAMMSDIGWGPLADLSVTMQTSTDHPAINAPFTTTFIVSNAGSQKAEQVIFTHPIPENISITQTIPDQGSCSTENQLIRCSLGSIAANKMVQIVLQLQASEISTFSLSGSVAGDVVDPDITNNESSESFISTAGIADNTASNTADNTAAPSAQSDTNISQQKAGGSLSWLCLIIGLLFLFSFKKMRSQQSVM